MRKILSAFIALFFISGNQAQIVENLQLYSAISIPDSLKKGADAVYRLDETIIEVSSPSKYTHATREIVALLNKDASEHLLQYAFLDKFEKVDDIEVKLYNALGMEVRKYKKKDFEVSAYDGNNLHTDNKLMQLNIPYSEYPCTVEINQSRTVNGYIQIPTGVVQRPRHAVERYSYTIKVPPQLDIHYKTKHIDLKPEISKTSNQIIYKWQARNLKAFDAESSSWKYFANYPHIRIAPSQFDYDGYKGSANSWKEFGAWAYPMYEDPGFTAARKEEIKKLIGSVSDKREQAKILYRYLQQNFRYVSIQLGIGGFKPFSISFVDEKKYGDCKALTNYMRYLLKLADIHSLPALINAGRDYAAVDPAFPSNGFNHVILCIPMQKDTIWLECTSKMNAFGELGSFTENKNALLLTDKGGVLVATPKSQSAQNQLHTRTDIKLDKDGAANITAIITCSGEFAEDLQYVEEKDKATHKRFIVEQLSYKSPEEFSFAASSPEKKGSEYKLTAFYDQAYDFKAGNKFFFRQRMYPIASLELKTGIQRTTDLILPFPYQKSDTTVYHLPEGYKLDGIPPIVEIDNPFGYYRKEVKKDETPNNITIVTQLYLKKHIIPAQDYNTLSSFFQNLAKADAAKIVIIGE